ncbi:MAG TPA: hypothetical protein DCE18_14740 [Syntrophobacteraceae bacterium]|nr:hypothetical protein [Syntrophobacteraceae bacterium]
MDEVQRKILFVCYGNACRSIMAEALAKHHLGSSIQAASAGIAPLGHIPENTLLVLEELEVPSMGLHSKSIDAVPLDRFDCIINLSDMPLQAFIPRRFHDKVVDCHIQDPFGGSLDTYRKTRDLIEQVITNKLSDW